ncbi:hypothetical protein ACIQC5_09755 [Paenarthrobacter sp. NPDC092416]|uniref:hypothetical protein n=1 Tax=Paenarthrobacter sp. NPDC092416 TaxID=3364386 RepID=UPI0037F4CD6B
MTRERTMTGSVLHAIGLLSTVLALTAGILGMHVMPSSHSMHTMATITGSPTATTGVVSTIIDGSAAGHSGHAGPAQERIMSQNAADSETFPSRAQCSCSGNCPNQHMMTAPCIPSVAPVGLSAPLPVDSVSITAPSRISTMTSWSLWAYRPAGPSPGELSISRT